MTLLRQVNVNIDWFLAKCFNNFWDRNLNSVPGLTPFTIYHLLEPLKEQISSKIEIRKISLFTNIFQHLKPFSYFIKVLIGFAILALFSWSFRTLVSNFCQCSSIDIIFIWFSQHDLNLNWSLTTILISTNNLFIILIPYNY